MATVIVKKEDEYAFYRGTVVHQPQSYAPPPQQQQFRGPGDRAPARKGEDFDALKNNFDNNIQNRARQIQWLQQEVYNKQQQGVEVYRRK
jgi:hypothetical protein